jgi:hypothetical protein
MHLRGGKWVVDENEKHITQRKKKKDRDMAENKKQDPI